MTNSLIQYKVGFRGKSFEGQTLKVFAFNVASFFALATMSCLISETTAFLLMGEFALVNWGLS